MDLAFSRFDRASATPLPAPPDFAVLVAGLSARQATSPTVRSQTLISRGSDDAHGQGPLVGLFAEGRKPRATDGRFSAVAADDEPR